MPYKFNAITGRLDLVDDAATIPLPVAEGGTGRTTLTDGAVLVGNGTSPVTMIGPLSDGQLLIGSTAGVDPVPATLTPPVAGIDITVGAGTITFSLDDDLSALEGLATTGVAVRTAASTWTTRTITGTGGEISISDGSGVSGNPTIAIDDEFKNEVGSVKNLGITISGGTVTINAADGTALSATNPAYIVMPSVTPGQSKVYKLTANYSMTNTEMNGNLFGTTTLVAWANIMPFFLYFMIDDAEATPIPAFGRIPNLTVSPAAANIGDPSAANADQQYSLYAWDNITEADYESNPVICIGSIRATKDAADVWTLTISDETQGIGLYQEEVQGFAFPVGQSGNDAGSYFIAGGGTIPIFTTNSTTYRIMRNGQCIYSVNFNGDGGADGAGAVAVKMGLPFTAAIYGLTAVDFLGGFGRVIATGGPSAGVGIFGVPLVSSATPNSVFIYTNADFMEYQDFGNGNRFISFQLRFDVANA